MTSADGRAVRPTLSAELLAAAVPGTGIGDVADIRGETLAVLPRGSLNKRMVVAALAWATEAVDAGSGGRRTYAGDGHSEGVGLSARPRFWDRPEPLVVTGAIAVAAAYGKIS